MCTNLAKLSVVNATVRGHAVNASSRRKSRRVSFHAATLLGVTLMASAFGPGAHAIEAPAPINWSGFYAGVNVGGGWVTGTNGGNYTINTSPSGLSLPSGVTLPGDLSLPGGVALPGSGSGIVRGNSSAEASLPNP